MNEGKVDSKAIFRQSHWLKSLLLISFYHLISINGMHKSPISQSDQWIRIREHA